MPVEGVCPTATDERTRLGAWNSLGVSCCPFSLRGASMLKLSEDPAKPGGWSSVFGRSACAICFSSVQVRSRNKIWLASSYRSADCTLNS